LRTKRCQSAATTWRAIRIVYRDDVTGLHRRTAFWRMFDGEEHRFRVLEDPDREYSD